MNTLSPGPDAQTFIPGISYSPYWNIDRNSGLVCAFEKCQTQHSASTELFRAGMTPLRQ
jgi:hypothetical protein